MAKAGGIEAGRAFVRIGSDDTDFQRGLRESSSRLKSFAREVQAVGQVALVAGAAILAAFSVGVPLAAQFEQATVAMTTMLKSGEKARGLLEDLSTFAASTPYQFPDLVLAAKRLIAFGTAADDVVPTLRMIGDVAAGTGADIGELAVVYGKAQINGRLMAKDINQLTMRGVPIIQQFAKQMGVAEGEVRDLVSQGAIGFPMLRKAFQDLTANGGQFENMMKSQSSTLAGLWSTLKDNVSLALRQLSEQMIDTFDVKGLIGRLIGAAQSVAEFVKEHQTLVKVLGVAAMALASVGGALTAVAVGVRTYSMLLNAARSATVIFSGVVKGLQAACVASAGAVKGLSVALTFLAAHPAVAVATVITTLVAAIVLYKRYAAGAASATDALSGALSRAVTSFDRLSKQWDKAMEGLTAEERLKHMLGLLDKAEQKLTDMRKHEVPIAPNKLDIFLDPDLADPDKAAKKRKLWKHDLKTAEAHAEAIKQKIAAERKLQEAATRAGVARNSAELDALRAEQAGQMEKAELIRLKERQRLELEAARERNATADELATIEGVHAQQITNLRTKYRGQEYEQARNLEERLADLSIQSIEDRDEREKETLALKQAREREAAADDPELLALLDRIHAIETEELLKEQSRRAAERTAQIMAAQTDLQLDTARERLKLQYTGLKLQLEELKIERRRAIEAARAQGLDTASVEEKYDIMAASLMAQDEAARKLRTSAQGTFSGFAARLMGRAAGSAEDRTAAATEETARIAKRIYDAIKDGGLAWQS